MTDETRSPGMFEHLFLEGRKGPSEEWIKREADRRAGRGRKEWWKQEAGDPESLPILGRIGALETFNPPDNVDEEVHDRQLDSF